MIAVISREALKQKMDRGDAFTLVETLSKTTFEHVHLPGAINLPPDQIKELAPTLLPNKQDEIIVYCAKPS